MSPTPLQHPSRQVNTARTRGRDCQAVTALGIQGCIKVALQVMTVTTAPDPQHHIPRTLAAVFLLGCTLWSSLADAIIINLNNRANTRIDIRVGGNGNNISEVTFAVPAAQLGNGIPITGSPQIRFRLQVRASGANPVTATLTVNSTGTLVNNDVASTSFIPFSDISWVSRDGDIPSGEFTNSPNQDIVDVRSSRRYADFHTFSYKNTSTLEAGTYEGRVIYTFAAP